MAMSGDETARAFDRLLAEFLEAAARRASLGSPLPGKGRKGDASPAWFASRDGRAVVKKTLLALKEERKALRALARFSRKSLKDDRGKSPADKPGERASTVPAEAAPGRAAEPGPTTTGTAARAVRQRAQKPATSRPVAARGSRAAGDPVRRPRRRHGGRQAGES